jgi:hypothetical protein
VEKRNPRAESKRAKRQRSGDQEPQSRDQVRNGEQRREGAETNEVEIKL